MEDETFVAVALLARTNIEKLGSDLKKVFPIDDSPCFQELLRAIDEADREHWRGVDRQSPGADSLRAAQQATS